MTQRTTLIRYTAGSRLHGTYTTNSDKDYIEVYIPSRREILLGDTRKATHTSTGGEHAKNDKDDEDVTSMTIQEYLHQLSQGSIQALETLFATNNPECIDIIHPLWSRIIKNRDFLVNRHVGAVLGFMTAQSNKFIVNDDYAQTLSNVIGLLKSLDRGRQRLSDVQEDLRLGIDNIPHTAIVDIGGNFHLRSCGRSVPLGSNIKYAIKGYQKCYEGHTSRKILTDDMSEANLKSVAHVIRVGQQLLEYLDTNNISFPRPNAGYLLSIRRGEVSKDVWSKQINSLILTIKDAELKLSNKYTVAVMEYHIMHMHMTALG